MNWFHLLIAFIPNALICILTFAASLGVFQIIFPSLFNIINNDQLVNNRYSRRTSMHLNQSKTALPQPNTFASAKKAIFNTLVSICLVGDILSLILFLWSWFTAAIIDPGSVIEDLKRRKIRIDSENFHLTDDNVLKKRNEISDNITISSKYCSAYDLIRSGKIPSCLQHLPICSVCKVPCPPGTAHCKICGFCILRFDHHCPVLGQCIGDKNQKSFLLTFFYLGFFCLFSSIVGAWFLLSTPYGIFSLTNLLTFILTIYTTIGFFSTWGFGVSFLYTFFTTFNMRRDDQFENEDNYQPFNNPNITFKMKWRKFLMSLGDNWMEILLPINNKITYLAWPTVHWDSDNLL